MAYLTDAKGQRFELATSPTIIGIGPGSDVVLGDGYPTRWHAVLAKVDERWQVYEFRSGAYVCVNGQAVLQKGLCDGDRLEIGMPEGGSRTTWTFRDPDRADPRDVAVLLAKLVNPNLRKLERAGACQEICDRLVRELRARIAGLALFGPVRGEPPPYAVALRVAVRRGEDGVVDATWSPDADSIEAALAADGPVSHKEAPAKLFAKLEARGIVYGMLEVEGAAHPQARALLAAAQRPVALVVRDLHLCESGRR